MKDLNYLFYLISVLLDQLNKIASAEEVKKWVQQNSRKETKFTWLIMESVLLMGYFANGNTFEG